MSGKPTRLVIAVMRVIMGFVVLTPTASLQCEGWDMFMEWRNVYMPLYLRGNKETKWWPRTLGLTPSDSFLCYTADE
jgi:hypothetical protein